MSDFVNLHLHTEYSLLDGMSGIKPLVKKIREQKMKSCAITDHGVLYGAHEFYEECKKNGIKPIIGVEIYLASNSRFDKPQIREDNYTHLILLAKNNIGYQNLVKIVSDANINGFHYKPRTDMEYLSKHKDGLIVLSGCLDSKVASFAKKGNLQKTKDVVLEFYNIFGKDNFYLEVQRNGLKEMDKVNEVLLKIGNDLGIPVVATIDSHYINKSDSTAHDIFLCIETGKTIDDPKRLKFDTNEFYLKSPQEMSKLWKDHPEVLENTIKIANACNVTLEFENFIFPVVDIPIEYGDDTSKYFRDFVFKRGKEKLKREFNKEELNRINYELDIIISKGFASYILMVSDFTDFLLREKIPTTTRGSAAGSFVAYLIGIVPINPLIFGLSFERFLNPLRPKAPDIDLDIASARRDDVLDYAISKYGKENVSQIVTFGRMKARAAIRDVGRVLGVPLPTVDRVAKLIPQGRFSIKESIRKIPELKDEMKDESVLKILENAEKMENVARHASIHACGVLITPKKLTEYIPVSFDKKTGRFVCQYNMVSLEDLGYMKMDFLGLTNLDIITDTIKFINDNEGKNLDLDNIPLDDKKTFKLLGNADTLGIFQIESRIMKDAIKILHPETIFDIAALIALNRPGPMANIPIYAARKEGKMKVEYLDPRMKKFLERSYGVLVYQEDLLKSAIELAGFDWGEVDKLRKATGKKKPEILLEMKDELVTRFVKNGMSEKKALQLFDLFMPFTHYAFNEAHAASYAMISYKTAYLKANYPVEFLAALLKADIGKLEKIADIVDEVKRKKINILPCDINRSSSDFTIENGNIRFGLSSIKGVSGKTVSHIVDTRLNKGEFTSLDDFFEKIDLSLINKKSIDVLIRSGSMDIFGERTALLSSYQRVLDFHIKKKAKLNSIQIGFFDDEEDSVKNELDCVDPVTDITKALWEKELLGIYITMHPLEKFIPYFEKSDINVLKDIKKFDNGDKISIGGVIQNLNHYVTKKTSKRMAFAKLEDGFISCDLVIFPDVYEKVKSILFNGGIAIVSGVLNVTNIENVVDVDESLEAENDFIEYKIIVDDIKMLNDSDLENLSMDRVEISISEDISKEKLSEINRIILSNPGNISVYIKLIKDGSFENIIKLKNKVMFSKELTSQIINITGEGSINII